MKILIFLFKPHSSFNFFPFLEGMHRELEAMGFQLDIQFKEKNAESGVCSAFLKANTLSLLLSLQEKFTIKGINPEQKIQIKLEIDTDPPLKYLNLESKLIKNLIPFYVSTYSPPDLFADKMHAALCRNWQKWIKGRDWYDFIWYI